MQSSAPDDGRKHRPKHVEPTWNNKLIYILHLVGYFRIWKDYYLFRRTSGLVVDPTQPPIQCFLLVKWSGCEGDFSPQSNAEINP